MPVGKKNLKKVYVTTDVADDDFAAMRKHSLSFNVSFQIKGKCLLQDVFAEVHSGECLAVMGPSGAGKTTLLSVLTLEAKGGHIRGTVMLNGEKMSSGVFKRCCSVVTQEDNHWGFLTCRETLTYAIQLYYAGLTAQEIEERASRMIKETGLETCADTRVGSAFVKGISGGQKRRLSVAVALLKELKVIYLDEPTSGLDSASAANIMRFIGDVTRANKLITLITVHQPSSAVYNGFDQVMILSRGELAYCGKAGKSALDYFSKIGFPIPPSTNPAEFMIDLVNADFSEESDVDAVLQAWKSVHPVPAPPAIMTESLSRSVLTRLNPFASGDHRDTESELGRQIITLLRRHTLLAIRDPLMYSGRMVIVLISTIIFAFIYWKARVPVQDQVLNRLYYVLWTMSLPTNMAVTAVYAYNQDFFSIKREAKNGMVSPIAYVIAVAILQIAAMVAVAFCSLTIGGYAVMQFNIDRYGEMIFMYACLMYAFEAIAQLYSVMFSSPLIGMLSFILTWFVAFLFCGLLLPYKDILWPFTAFTYINPLGYGMRSIVYSEFIDQDWRGAYLCDPNYSAVNDTSFCYSVPGKVGPMDGWSCGQPISSLCFGKLGWQVLHQVNQIFSLTVDRTMLSDICLILAIAFAVKMAHAYLLNRHCSRECNIVFPTAGKGTHQ